MRGSKRVLLMLPVLGTLAVGLVPAMQAVAGLPSGTTAVHVTAGATHTGINAAIGVGGEISGKITSGGHALPNVFVVVMTSKGSFVNSASTGSGGVYHVGSLPPTSTGYVVCAQGTGVPGGPSAYGYVSRCYKSATWNGVSVPKSATRLGLRIGHPRTGINISLSKAGAITGSVKPASGSGTLNDVFVQIYTSGGSFVSSATVSKGTYKASNLVPTSKGYRVCFSTAFAQGGSSKTGYLGECYNNVAWGGAKPSSSSKLVKVHGGIATRHINAALSVAGAISGTIRQASSGHKRIRFSSIEVFTKGGSLIGFGSGQSNGNYKIVGLRPHISYVVCASGGQVSGVTGSYGGRCYKNVAWNFGKPSSKATGVGVTAGKTHGGVSMQLPHVAPTKVGSISGKVTGTGSKLLQSVGVTAYTGSGSEVGTSFTAANGTYKISNLNVSSSGYVVCFRGSDAFPNTGTPPPTGYRSVCYRQIAWAGGKPPPHTTRVSVKAGKTHANINAVLSAGGAISGTVTNAATHAAMANVSVYVFTSSTQFITSTSTASDGKYTLKGLTPRSAGYTVCFSARFVSSAPATGFRNECYNNRPWDDSGF